MLSYIRIGNTMELTSVCLSACVHRAIVYYDFYLWGKQFISTVQFKNMYVVAQTWTSAINDDDTWHCLGTHLVRGMSVLRD